MRNCYILIRASDQKILQSPYESMRCSTFLGSVLQISYLVAWLSMQLCVQSDDSRLFNPMLGWVCYLLVVDACRWLGARTTISGSTILRPLIGKAVPGQFLWAARIVKIVATKSLQKLSLIRVVFDVTQTRSRSHGITGHQLMFVQLQYQDVATTVCGWQLE